jgi:hypothetical protein
MSFLSLVACPSLYLIRFNDSFDKDLLSVLLLLRQSSNKITLLCSIWLSLSST